MLKPKYILRLMTVAAMLLLAVAPAMAQTNSVYAGQTSTLGIVEIPGDIYEWEIYNDVTNINFATDAGNCPQTEAVFTGGVNTGSSVQVSWLNPGTYYYKVTARRAGCTMNLKVGQIEVKQPLSIAVLSLTQPSTCIDQGVNLEISLTGTGPWNIIYRITKPDGSSQDIPVNNISVNLTQIPFNPTSTGAYTFEVISVTDAFYTNNTPSNTVILTVNAKPGSSHIYQYEPVSKKKK